MRFYLTNSNPDLESALTAAGHAIVSGPGGYQTDDVEELTQDVPDGVLHPVTRRLLAGTVDAAPGDYRLNGRLRDSSPDVVILWPFLQPGFGFPLAGAMSWRNMQTSSRRRLLVGMGEDPETLAHPVRQLRGCTCRWVHLDAYLSNAPEGAAASARDRRSASWRPGEPLTSFLAALEHAMSGRSYQAGRRSSPF